VKAGMPIRVGEDDVGRAVQSVLVGPLKEAAAVWPKSEHIEVIAAREDAPRACGTVTRVEADKLDVVRGQLLETVVAIPQVDVIRVGLIRGIVAVAVNRVQALRPR